VSGTQTCTIHGPQSLELGPGCGQADAFINGDGVRLVTVNKAGDSWVTGTVEGQFVVVDALGSTVGTGRATSWFGVEDNNQTQVQHFTADGFATCSMARGSASTPRGSSW
jgi:hypothetical protein